MTDRFSPPVQDKFCPQCGQRNHRTAKVCIQCGHVFRVRSTAANETEARKQCPKCGRENNVNAKFCAECGHQFQVLPAKAAQPGEAASVDKSSDSQKWCPQCGTVNKLAAKVCIQCGHRFKTQPGGKGSPQSELRHVTEIVEPPITQDPESPLTLPPEFPSPIEKTIGANPIAEDTGTAASRVNNLEGEPAPDLSSDQLDSLREQSSENVDPYERLKRSLQRKPRIP